jgi:VanZ family protein
MNSLLLNLLDPSPSLRRLSWLVFLLMTVALLYLGSRAGASAVIPPPPLDKLLHMGVFGMLAAIAWVACGSRAVLAPLLIVAFVGLADEGWQALSPERVASVTDLVADVVGASTALLMLTVLRRLVLRVSDARAGRPE